MDGGGAGAVGLGAGPVGFGAPGAAGAAGRGGIGANSPARHWCGERRIVGSFRNKSA